MESSVRGLGKVLLLLALSPGPAWADWLKVVSTEQDDFYLATGQSNQYGVNFKVWILRDHLTARHGKHGA